MKLTERINADFMTAFKAKEIEKKNFLGVVKGEIQNEVGRSGKEDDETVLRILTKMEKSLKQTNTTESLTELEYIKPYLPTRMSGDEIETIVRGYYNDNGLTTMALIMREFNINYKGKADNQEVSAIINKVIAGR